MKGFHSRKKGRSLNRKGGRGLWKGLFTKRFLVFGALLFFVGAGIALSVWLYRASAKIFPVKEIVLYGNMHLSEGEVRTIACVKKGESLFSLSKRGIAEKLLKSPWIRDVAIRKDFPDRISVKIYEASPFAILEMKGKTFLIDEMGRMLEEMRGAVPFLPVITADPYENHDNFLEALNLARIVKEKKIATEKNRVEILAGKGPESISMVVDNLVIKIGNGDYEQKLRRLFELEEEIKKRAISVDYVDLRYANRVVVKPISEVVR